MTLAYFYAGVFRVATDSRRPEADGYKRQKQNGRAIRSPAAVNYSGLRFRISS